MTGRTAQASGVSIRYDSHLQDRAMSAANLPVARPTPEARSACTNYAKCRSCWTPTRRSPAIFLSRRTASGLPDAAILTARRSIAAAHSRPVCLPGDALPRERQWAAAGKNKQQRGRRIQPEMTPQGRCKQCPPTRRGFQLHPQEHCAHTRQWEGRER